MSSEDSFDDFEFNLEDNSSKLNAGFKKLQSLMSDNVTRRSKKHSDRQLSSNNKVPSKGDLIMDMLINLTSDIQNIKKSIDSYNSKVSTLMKENDFLKDEIFHLRRENDEIKDRLLEIENVKLKNKILISGPKLKNTNLDDPEVTKGLIIESTKLPIERLDKVDISRFKDKEDAFLIDTKDSRLNSELFVRFRREKPKDIYINDLLSPLNSRISYKLRCLKKRKKIYSVFSFNGTVYYKVTENSDRIAVRSTEELNEAIFQIERQ